jgi:hypothetical protein
MTEGHADKLDYARLAHVTQGLHAALEALVDAP